MFIDQNSATTISNVEQVTHTHEHRDEDFRDKQCNEVT